MFSGAQIPSQGVWGEDQVTIRGPADGEPRACVSIGCTPNSPDRTGGRQQLEETGKTIKGLGDMFTWKSWSPRLGFNLKLTDDGKTILRGNYGRAYRHDLPQ